MPHQSRLIRSALIARGVNLAEVARQVGTNRGPISRIVSGETRSRRIERRICRLIGMRWAAVFPPLKRRPIGQQRYGSTAA